MGKWAARLTEERDRPRHACTDETDKRVILSVLAVRPEGFANDLYTPLSPPVLTQELPDRDPVVWSSTSITQYKERRKRLLSWGWTRKDAEQLSKRLAERDLDQDPRVNCADCQHYRPGRCGNHRRAGLNTADTSRDLTELLQHCAGFELVEPNMEKLYE